MQEFFFQAIPSNFMATEKVMIYLDSAASTPLHECVRVRGHWAETPAVGPIVSALGLKSQVEECS